MIKWKLLEDNIAQATWDQELARFDDCSPFQSYAWGEYRRGLGWKPYRWAAFNEADEIVAMLQGYVRRYFLGIGLLWSEGGPVGDVHAWDESLQQSIQQTAGLRRVYFRFRCDRERNIDDVLRLRAGGWSRPWAPMTSDYSMTADLSLTEEQMLKGCERNWRRNLKRANEANLVIREWMNPDADEIASVYASMQQVKGIEEQHSRDEIEQLLKSVNDKLVLIRCEDEKGQLLSLMAAVVVGTKACSVLSATSERGREFHSSYAIFWAMLRHCQSLGVTSYDLAGIDPVANPGVYRFKRASGATPIELLGEWDWASRPWLRWLGNWAIGQRKRVRQAETVLNQSVVSNINERQEKPPLAATQVQLRRAS